MPNIENTLQVIKFTVKAVIFGIKVGIFVYDCYQNYKSEEGNNNADQEFNKSDENYQKFIDECEKEGMGVIQMDYAEYEHLLENYRCPISMDIMTNPYLLTKCGHTFEKDMIISSLKVKSGCPVCRSDANFKDLAPNVAMRESIIKQQKEILNLKTQEGQSSQNFDQDKIQQLNTQGQYCSSSLLKQEWHYPENLLFASK